MQALASSEIPYDCFILDLGTAQLTIAIRRDRTEALASGFQAGLFFGLRARLQQRGGNSRIPSEGLSMPIQVRGGGRDRLCDARVVLLISDLSTGACAIGRGYYALNSVGGL